jgi:hypothetical protein
LAEDTTRDHVVRERLSTLRSDHEDLWAYCDRRPAEQQTVLFQYPAMMVAEMQRDLSAMLLRQIPQGDGPLFDPFVGSGTILGAGMALGRDVVGWDINPLAILICRVKAGPMHLAAFEHAAARTCAPSPRARRIEERFANWRHWFTDDVARSLTALRAAIRREPSAAARRFLWICLAETVRRTSNSRTSTVKLHRRPAEQVASRPDPHAVFRRVCRENLSRLRAAALELSEAGVLSRGWYRGDVRLALGDTRTLRWTGEPCAALVTSPPYGDNTSTIPYGQHAYLPLQWIDLQDIDPEADPGCLASTYEIDRRSLGGDKRIADGEQQRLSERSPTLKRLMRLLASEKTDRRNRVLAHARDLDSALRVLAPTLQADALSAWTVGSRRVGGQQVALQRILPELAASYGLLHVETLQRRIPGHRKRMAPRNSLGATMQREHIVIFRREVP